MIIFLICVFVAFSYFIDIITDKINKIKKYDKTNIFNYIPQY